MKSLPDGNLINHFMMQLTEQEATEFWMDILGYGDACSELGDEGNSGEFHDKRTYNKLVRELKEKQEQLIETFGILTGWTPVFVEGTKKNNYNDTWKFTPYEPSN